MDPGAKVSPADAAEANNKMFGGKVNLEKGREVAIARIDASHGMPARRPPRSSMKPPAGGTSTSPTTSTPRCCTTTSSAI